MIASTVHDPFSTLDAFGGAQGQALRATPPKEENVISVHQQHPQTPAEITPDNPNGTLVQINDEQQYAYSHYQVNFGTQQTHMTMSPAPTSQPNQMIAQASPTTTMDALDQQLAKAALSPPISPILDPTSPGSSPPDPQVQRISTISTETALTNNVALMPSLADNLLSPSIPAQVVAANPFDMFASAPQQTPPGSANAVTPPSQPSEHQQQDDAQFWNDMGFCVPSNNGTTISDDDISHGTSEGGSMDESEAFTQATTTIQLDEHGMPAGGEYYTARVTTPMLGAIFTSGYELRSTLFQSASDCFVEAIGHRPVISFTIDGSAADTTGIQLGHILLKINGEDVKHTDDAVKMVMNAPRPMNMEYYIPDKDVKCIKSEGQCMVKYDNNSTDAPGSSVEWKPKYVVIGDMLGKPHIIYMYRSKAEYDIAVRESQSRVHRAISVKVKQFDIRGSRIFNEQGTVRYPNKPSAWHYFSIVRPQGLPIKISACTAELLQPIYEGVANFLDGDSRKRPVKVEEQRERIHYY